MKNRLLKEVRKIHFVGIGGIGVSAIARMARLEGIKVSGSDVSEGPMTEKIRDIGGNVFIGHNEKNLLKDTDFVVYSPAIGDDNVELIKARELGIPVYSYPEVLGLISRDMHTIAVSGTHGKTTTTSMIAELMIYGNLDPSVVVGGLLKKQKDNFVLGESDYFVVEACEHKKSFLHLSPNILVITNIDKDHLDFYGSLDNICSAFGELIKKVDGFVVCDIGDKNVRKAFDYAGDISAKVVDYRNIGSVDLSIPGAHNALNAQAALSVGDLVGIDFEKGRKIIKEYSGCWRRFDFVGKTENDSLVYTDYAHHPVEVEAVVKSALEGFDREVVVVFQPHLFSRTKFFLKDFASALGLADKVVVTDIYAAREKDDGSIHARDLVDLVDGAKYISNFSDIVNFVEKQKKSLVLIIGAGDIYSICKDIAS
ncbi:MAG: UDP-N-acetylmuramate--L-alanine ligase [Candidatus Portnoybacteria bacterium]|nr:UDP-N-acetylmuramate--L-alanine ligase [Candidatus Portnoybacteria bacterium]